MPFPRCQGEKIQILHSKRVGAKVRQIKLHEFQSVQEAADTLSDASRWEDICASIKATLGPRSRWKPEELRAKLREVVDSVPRKPEKPSKVETLARQLSAALLAFDCELSTKRRRVLEKAREPLVRLIGQIPDTLARLTTKGFEGGWHDDYLDAGSAEQLFDMGLSFYEESEWDRARQLFQAGLELDPQHVDLHVHIGILQMQEENWAMALQHFERAIEYGKVEVEKLIESDPDHHCPDSQRWDRIKEMPCQDPGEHDRKQGERCKECQDRAWEEAGSFRDSLEVRPYCRALYNKGLVLMKMARWQDAIDAVRAYKHYVFDPGARSLISECFYHLGNFEESLRQYQGRLHPEDFFFTALKLLRLEREEDALWAMIEGVMWSPDMGRMLAGWTDPIEILSQASPGYEERQAAEYVTTQGELYRGLSRYRFLLDVVLEELGEDIEELEQALEDRGAPMPEWVGMSHRGYLSVDYIRDALDDLLKLDKLWLPRVEQVLKGQLVQRKKLNWKLKVGRRTVYVRGAQGDAEPGDDVRVKVEKAWRHRRSVFVSGTCLVAVRSGR